MPIGRASLKRALRFCLTPCLIQLGSYGIGVVGVEREEDVDVLIANDPVTKSGGKFRHEAYVMPQVIVPNQQRM